MNEVKLNMPTVFGKTVDWDEVDELTGTFLRIENVKKRDGNTTNVYILSLAGGDEIGVWERIGLMLLPEWIGRTLKISHEGMNKKYGKGIGMKYTFSVFEITK